jgi:hypothetical protein
MTDDVVEQVARVLCEISRDIGNPDWQSWDDRHEPSRNIFRQNAHAVIDAMRDMGWGPEDESFSGPSKIFTDRKITEVNVSGLYGDVVLPESKLTM